MKKTTLAVALAVLAPLTLAAAGFDDTMQKVLSDKCTKDSQMSITIESLGTGNVVYTKNPDSLLIPASNMKVVTAIAALEMLKPDFVFRTSFSYTGERKGDVIEGDLVVVGGGDPHIVIEDMFLMANELRKRGVKTIKGNLVLDGSYFVEGENFPEGWNPSSQRRAYEAPIGALAFNFNSFQISIYPPSDGSNQAVVTLDPETPYLKLVNRTRLVPGGKSRVTIDYKTRPEGGEEIVVGGTVNSSIMEKEFYRAVKDPVNYFGMTFKYFLSMNGISLEGEITGESGGKPRSSLFDYESKPLLYQVAYMNKYSNNFMAENILRTIAAEKVSVPGEQRKGVMKVQEMLSSLGITQERFRIYDGSGFAKENRLSSKMIVELLEHAYKDWEYGPEFISSLALMGRDGSVEERMTSTDKTIRVKTGTLKTISALSGYYPLKRGDILAFSMLFNDLACENGDAIEVQHRILREFDKIDVY